MEPDMSEFLTTLEEQFYAQGVAEGTPHGELHGLFEGRALGREKGWELWEEVGYYEGMATLWRAVLLAQAKPGRALLALEQVIAFVSVFPTTNDSALATLDVPSDVDIPALLTSIRSKYRTACASLGVRPRMAASKGEATVQEVNMSI